MFEKTGKKGMMPAYSEKKISDEDLDAIIDRDLAMMDPSYLEEKTVVSKMMRNLMYHAGILIAAGWFSRYPSIELGRRLREAGHRVVYAGAGDGKAVAEHNGLAFAPLVPSRLEELLEEDRRRGLPARLVDRADIETLDPPADFRGSAEYRRHLASVLVRRVVANLGGAA